MYIVRYADDFKLMCRTIIGNCGNQIYILTSDESTAKIFSEMLGK